MRAMRRWGALGALIVAPAVLGRLFPAVMTDHLALLIGIGLCYAIAALSLNQLTGYAGQISLGHAGLFGLGAFTSSAITTKLGFAMIAGLVTAVFISAACALLVGLPALRIRGVNLAIATLILGIALQQFVFRLPLVAQEGPGVVLPRPKFGDTLILNNPDYLPVILIVLVLVWMIDRNVTHSRLGRGLEAQRSNERLAHAFGVPVVSYRLAAFTLSGAIAGAGGSLFGHLLGYVQAETFGLDLSLGLLVVVVLGGVGSRGGVLVSALLFALLPRLLSPLRETALLVGGIGMLGALIAHPRGLGSLPDLLRGRRAGREAHLLSGGVAIPDLLIGRENLLNTVGAETVGGGLRVDTISVSFGGVRALQEASLTIEPGEAVGIIGPNGAGKSTLIECVSGFVAPEAGSISFQGIDLLTLPPRARSSLGIRRTFQIDGLVLDATVLNNVMMASHDRVSYGAIRGLVGTPRMRSIENEQLRSADEVLGTLGMDELRDLPARALSGGQRRVLEIACCLYGGPRLAMFDEPSAGLAPDIIEQLGDRLRTLVERTGSALLLVEHNISLVERVCDRLYVIVDGHVIMDGATSEVLSDPTIGGRLTGAAL